jgi:hypothetical protein
VNVFRKRWLKKQYGYAKSRQPAVADYATPQSLLVICDQRNGIDPREFATWPRDLGIEEAKFDVIGYAAEHSDDVEDIIYFGDDLFKWQGGLRDSNLAATLSRHHDLQINYFTDLNESLKFIASCSSAGLKAGLPINGAVHNDLTIDVPVGQLDTFILELKNYLEILTAKK